MPLSDACMLVTDALMMAVLSNQESKSFSTITIITGKGLHSGESGPVLQSGVLRFVQDQLGIETTPNTKNPGQFFIEAKGLQSFAQRGSCTEALQSIYLEKPPNTWNESDTKVIDTIFLPLKVPE